MRGFFDRLQWRMAGWMQGRHGADSLSNMLIVVGLVLTLASVVPGLDLLSWAALVCLVLALFRCFSRNEYKRASENEAYRRIVAKPKQAMSVAGKAWENRKTTCYFKCKKCGAVLSVPRGKGTLRVTCPVPRADRPQIMSMAALPPSRRRHVPARAAARFALPAGSCTRGSCPSAKATTSRRSRCTC